MSEKLAPKLYVVNGSPYVRAVLITAKAIGLELALHEVDFYKSEHLSREYLKLNPQHTVPTLDDGGKIIWDSHAIMPYLVEKYSKDDYLYPKDLYKRALINQRLHFESGTLSPQLHTIGSEFMKGNKDPTPKTVADPANFLGGGIRFM